MNESPIALQGCAGFQIFTDLCILSQFMLYRNSSAILLPMERRIHEAEPAAQQSQHRRDAKKADFTLSDSGGEEMPPEIRLTGSKDAGNPIVGVEIVDTTESNHYSSKRMYQSVQSRSTANTNITPTPSCNNFEDDI